MFSAIKRYLLAGVGIAAAFAIGVLYVMLRIARGHAAAANHAAAQAKQAAAAARLRAMTAAKSAKMQRQVSIDAAQAAMDAANAPTKAPDPVKRDDFETTK